ncbi:MAG: outer membrane lipoprotein LolB [Xanthomonadales bacterium]|nr:lipoprotein insertase outer membrane protein LolB [Gammaproteobacteria bacterium]MBT8053348.1 lipoprotein insertase outer membrane protein LolB [Gammaproteobacteria bacterium]NND58060.1 outer membrane lipoprotein LolB [Xanthomonadales bacterium]NNK52157.1 outer membrane lipoprotein LolB [Xanthomonadales bacterium]
MRPVVRSATAALLLLLTAACSSIPPAAQPGEAERARLYDEHFDRLASRSVWDASGRLAISGEEDGGSGNFKWQKTSLENRINFHGALGRGAWTLESDENGAMLALADGSVYRAGSIDELVHVQLGWKIPVDHLSWWVRGLAAPGAVKTRVLDEQGNLSELLQDGWVIEFGKYRVFDDLRLPVRLTARQEGWKVKLAIRSWKTNAEALPNER